MRSGMVAVVGKANAGKSTLVNVLVGEKVAIVSPKPQTTRNRILGVMNREDAQVAFVDTPGIYRSKTALSDLMMRTAETSAKDVDMLLYVHDGHKGFDDSDIALMKREMVPFREAQSVRVFSGFADRFKDQSFDFICIDAPLGADMKEYARVDVLGLMPQILKKSFVLLLDDFERPGEQHTARAMEEALKDHGIPFAKGVYSGLKKTLVLCSLDNRFFTSL